MPKLQLHWQILIAIGLAAVAGWLSGPDGALGPLVFSEAYDFVGTLFLNGLKMVIVPLIAASIISSIASIGSSEDLGRLGVKTISYYMATSLVAILVGLVFVNVVQPGLRNGEPVGALLNLDMNSDAIAGTIANAEGRGAADILGIFMDMVPTNVVQAAADNQMLALIFFSLLFGYFMTRIPARQGEVLILFWQGVSETMMKVTMWVMKFAPIGVFGLVADTVANTGFAALMPMLWFFFTVLFALMFHLFVVLGLLVRIGGKVGPIKHLKAMLPGLLTAFSTASSSASLPVNMECMQKNVGVSERISSFVQPLGATINMDGTALYECAAALFLAQAYGLHLSLGTQFTVVFIALLTSIGVAGIPAASLVAIAVILTAIGLPVEAIGLLLVTDRVLDMVRTSINVYSDACCATVIARSEKEDGFLI
ncbi:MAG TPA: dicarboxylate/amino acid:cation symporter [Hyphomicrobiales bacterium]|nr:dicarboxylate/amino acid:cation symporter [Hyphomicrobiales bacterium]